MSSLFYRGIYGMVNCFRFLFCTLACFFSITSYASDLPANPRNDTPAQSLKRLQNNFKSQANYDAGMKRNLAEIDARIYMNEGTNRASVEQMLTRSGVLESGAKAEVVAKVTQPANTGKVAKTLVDRLAKAKDYAKHVGKASIPTFVGMAAFEGLMRGVDYVMDEGGQVRRKDDQGRVILDKYTSPYVYFVQDLDTPYYDLQSGCIAKTPEVSDYSISFKDVVESANGVCRYTQVSKSDGSSIVFGISFVRQKNSNYNPNATKPDPKFDYKSDADIQKAFEDALKSNNPALAAAIAEAIKAAYSFDGTEGQDNSTNTAVIGTANDMNEAVDRAFDNPTSNATSDKPSGYHKITDGEKTIEGYVTTPDTTGKTEIETKTTTTTDPVTGNQTTTGTSTGSLQFPAFCDWAGIVCDWINWTKEEPDQPEEPKPVFEEINVPLTPFSIANFNAQCPPDENLSLNLMGQEMSFVFPMKPFCDFFSGIKPFVIALASFWAVKLIGNASFNSGN